jgi:uncharacterized protein YdaU (DUF1376 family)
MSASNGKRPRAPESFQFFARDFLTDERLMMMPLDAQGAYQRLRAYQWVEGSIPDNFDALAKMCGVAAREMKRMWVHLDALFPSSAVFPGRRQNPELERIREENAAWREKKSEGGRKGASIRWGHPHPEQTVFDDDDE